MSTSVSSLSTNFFPSAENGFTTTTSGSVSSGAATVGLNSVSGWSNGEIAVFVIDPTDANKKQTFTGVIDTSGVQVTSVVWTAGTNQAHALGATVVDYATATHISMMTKGLLIAHEQTGIHKSGATYPSPVFSGSVTGTYTLAGTPTISGATYVGVDGYISTTDTWVYASASTFTIAGVDRTAQFPVGTKIKLTQTTPKYFYVVSAAFSTNTTITVTGGADYTLANAAITAPFYSYDANPQAFPHWFNFTPGTTTGWSGTPTTTGTRFSVQGRSCTYRFNVSGTSNATGVQISLPISAQLSATTGAYNWEGTLGLAQDNGTILTAAARQTIDPGTSLILLIAYTNMASGAWTAANAKIARGTAVYEI